MKFEIEFEDVVVGDFVEVHFKKDVIMRGQVTEIRETSYSDSPVLFIGDSHVVSFEETEKLFLITSDKMDE